MNNLDPRVKIIWAISSIFLIFTTYNLPVQIGMCCCILILPFLFGYSISGMIQPVKYFLFFLPFIFFIHLIFTSDFIAKIFQSNQNWLVELTQPLIFTFRIANFILLNSFLFKWIDKVYFLDAIYILLKPLKKIKIPVEDLFQVVFIGIRFFPIMSIEYKRIDSGWKNLIKTKQNTIKERILRIRDLIIPLMIFSFRKAEILAEAMTIRGYSGNNRTYYHYLKFCLNDFIFAILGIIFFLLIVIKIFI